MTFDLWWIAQHLGNLLWLLRCAIWQLFYMHAPPASHVPSDPTGDERSLFYHCAVHRSGGDRITWCTKSTVTTTRKVISRYPADNYFRAPVTELKYVLLCGQRQHHDKRRPSTCNSQSAESAEFSVITRSFRTRRLQSMRWIALTVPRPGAAILHNLRVLFYVLLCEIRSEQYLMVNLIYVLIVGRYTMYLIDVLLLLSLLCQCTTLWAKHEQTALNHYLAKDISRVTMIL